MSKRMYDDIETLQVMIDLYFDDPEKMLSYAGLALALGFSSRDILNRYVNRGEADGASESEILCGRAIKKAKLRVEAWTIERALKGGNAGSIFLAKNMGYTDRQIVEVEPVTIHISGTDAQL